MKTTKLFIAVFTLITLSFTVSNAQDKSNYTADTSNSTINWKGYKPTGSHHGTINLASGELKMENGKIIGGSFIANMSTIKDAGGSAKLERHLKSDDFFDVAAFSTCKFEITDSETIEGKTVLTGNMTIKGITKQLTFPVIVTETTDTVTLTSETFQVNRAEFNVKYKSKTFFNNLKEKFIKNEFDLQVVIVAVK
ncbi:YceI family protein [Lutibacter sp.]|uniref:YceI family protein n=1 Tax=Lutibacter sp. TaxID=1925666 RepID=UPI0025C15A41|nr:YceI family protein [Lutibacter sp.]MCF6168233.1 YceI family protein [Lutibacter sp.]